MVSSCVTVYSRQHGADEAWKWESRGIEGYTIEPCDMSERGTKIVLRIKDNEGEDNYDEFLDAHRIAALVRRYSDYIRYPIRMDMPQTPPEGRLPGGQARNTRTILKTKRSTAWYRSGAKTVPS